MSLSPLESNFSPLTANILNLINREVVRADETGVAPDRSTFSNLLQEAFETTEVTDRTDKTSAVELVIGQTDDISGLMLDATKAELALNLALQLRNKVIDAYNEIMRMQV